MPSHYDELSLQIWIKLNQSIFMLLLVRYLVTGKGKQPAEAAPKSALLSSPSHPPHGTVPFGPSSCMDIGDFSSVLVPDTPIPVPRLSPHCLWPLCLIYYSFCLLVRTHCTHVHPWQWHMVLFAQLHVISFYVLNLCPWPFLKCVP